MYALLKPALDFVFALFFVIVLLPVLLIICFLIKFDSPGPVLFKQKRIGMNGQLFEIYKFRSMRIDTPNVATDKLSNPKMFITRVGDVLRKTSLDELPQLINILKGDMSFVGPRPALFNQDDLIEMRKRQGVNIIKPGLTGYAQVKGRDNITDDEKVKYDRYYVQNYSLMIDMKIIFWTIIKVIKAEDIKG